MGAYAYCPHCGAAEQMATPRDLEWHQQRCPRCDQVHLPNCTETDLLQHILDEIEDLKEKYERLLQGG